MRKPINSKRIVFAMVLAIVLVLTGCNSSSKETQTPSDSSKDNGSTSVSGGTITVTSVREPDTVDIQRTTWADDANSHLYESLVRFDFEGNIVPALAQSYNVSDDGRQIAFTLHEGSTFHSGTPITAEGVKQSFERFVETAPTSYMVGPLEKVEVVDDLTFIFHFSEPFAPFLSNAATSYLAPLDPSVLDEYGDDFGTHASSAGILKLAEINRGTSLTYEPFSEYSWGPSYAQNKGAAKIDKVVFRFIADDDTRLLEFKRGNTQVILAVPPSYIAELEQDPNVTLTRTLANGITYLGMNNQKEIFQDVRVRQAIALAIDRTPIVEYALEGAAQPIFGPLPPTIMGYNQIVEDKAAEMYSRNIDEARRLLAEAGWDTTNNEGFVMKDGKPFTVELWVTQEPTLQRIAQILQNQLAEAGINLRISVQEDATVRAQTPEGAHEMILWNYGWYDADILHSLFGRGLSTRVHYQNDELIKLLEKARITVDNEERMKLYEEAQLHLVEESPWVPLFVRQNVNAFRDLENIAVHPITGSIIWSDLTLKE